MRAMPHLPSLCGGVALGAALGHAGIPALAALAEATGWPGLVASAGLLCASAAVFLGRGAAAVRDPFPAAPGRSLATASPVAGPEEWLRRAGAAGLPEGAAGEAVEAALKAQLSPHGGPAEAPVEVLRWCLLAIPAGTPLDGETPREVLASLDAALAGGRDEAVASMARRAAAAMAAPGSAEAAALAAITAAHGTRETAMVAALERARDTDDGACCADFPWLRARDRGLWFALNNVGRASFHVEGAAAIAHHAEEVRAGTALAVPRVGAAAAPLARAAMELVP